MLKQLYIKNFTLIDELDIPLYPGFSVITGETGAGKSIILGAIGLLLGNRADSKAIKAGRDRCVIEAHFDLSKYGMQDFFDANDIDYDAEDTIIRREQTAAGKSRAFINDTPVPLSKMRELANSSSIFIRSTRTSCCRRKTSSSAWSTLLPTMKSRRRLILPNTRTIKRLSNSWKT